MSAIEAYRVATVMTLDISQAMSEMRRMLEVQQSLAKANREIVDSFKQINGAAIAGSAGKFADDMARASASARATRDAMREGAAAAASYRPPASIAPPNLARAAQAPPPPPSAALMLPAPAVRTPPPAQILLPAPAAEPRAYQTPDVVVPPSAPSPLALPAPVRGFQTQGAPYIPGSALVPTGQGRTNTEATGARPRDPNEGALTVYRPPGALAERRGWVAGEPEVNPVPLPPIPAPAPRVLPTPSGHEFLMAGMAAEQAGRSALGIVGTMFDAAADAQSLIAKMRSTSGFDATMIQRAQDMARGLVGQVPGITYGQGLDLVLQTSSFTGDPAEALKLVPTLARNAQVLAQYGHGNAIDQIEKAVKAGELTGLTAKNGQINTDKLIEFVNRLTAVDMASAGTMDLGKYLTSIRQYGVGADAASMDFLTATLPAYQKIMGEAKAGTAFSSLLQSLSSTKPNTQNKSYLAEQRRLGLRDANNEVVAGDLLRTDANAWFTTKLLPAFLQANKITPQDQLAEFYRIFPRQTMVRAGAAGIFDQGIIVKESDRNRAQMAMGNAPMSALLLDSANNQVKAFGAALDLLKVSLTDPAMGNATAGLRTLTGALLSFSNWSKDHPGASNAAVTTGAAVAAGGAAAGTALLYGYFAKSVYDVAKWGMSKLPTLPKVPEVAKVALPEALETGAKWGALTLSALGWEAGKSVATSPDWQKLGDHIEKAVHAGVTKAATSSPTTVNVKVAIDGKDLPFKAYANVVKQAAGPETGTGSFDLGAMYSPPQH